MSAQEQWWHRAIEKTHCAWDRRKAEHVVRRRAQHEEIVPVLRSMNWRRIVAGRSRIKDIDTFIAFYEMYVPLLATHEAALVNARDSGLYEGFGLRASRDRVAVSGMLADGSEVVVAVSAESYWEDLYSFRPYNYTPW
jgi:hypothetical protein